jgi:hypothetical protein
VFLTPLRERVVSKNEAMANAVLSVEPTGAFRLKSEMLGLELGFCEEWDLPDRPLIGIVVYKIGQVTEQKEAQP